MRRLASTAMILVLGAALGLAQELSYNYVVKVTPALVYINGHLSAGVDVDNRLVIIRPGPPETGFVRIAEVTILEVLEKLVIAEIDYVVDGQTIEELDVAIAPNEWEGFGRPSLPAEALEEEVGEMGMETQEASPSGGVGLYFTGGYQRERGTDLRDTLLRKRDAGPADDTGMGLRLQTLLQGPVQLAFTYKYADTRGKLEGEFGARVGWYQLNLHSFEADLQYRFFARSNFAPYLSLGAGIHYIKLTGATLVTDTSIGPGVNLTLGAEYRPLDHWSLLYEHGYQYVHKGDGQIDFSNLRTYLGIGYLLGQF